MTIATKRNASIAAALLGFALIGSGCQQAQDAAEEAATTAESAVSSVIDDTTTTAAEPTPTGADAGAGTEQTTIAGADGTEYTVAGPILAKYNSLDEAGKTALGAPTGEQQSNPDGGVYQQFDGGVIIHSAESYVVWGKIRDKWNELGGSQGELGYPTSDETDNPEGNKQTTFERGTVTWNPTTDEVVVTMN